MREGVMGLAAAMLIAAAPAPAEQVTFTGNTTAGAVLVKDTLQTLAQYGNALFRCPAPSAVEASVLPDSYVPANPQYRLGTGKVVRERWRATFCGQQADFLVTFWPDPKGGTMFGIGYPYPDDAPAR